MSFRTRGFCLSISPPLRQSLSPSLHPSVSPSLHPFISPPLRQSLSPSLHLSIPPSVPLSIPPSCPAPPPSALLPGSSGPCVCVCLLVPPAGGDEYCASLSLPLLGVLSTARLSGAPCDGGVGFMVMEPINVFPRFTFVIRC